MTFRDYIDYPCGLRFIYDSLELLSPLGRRAVLDTLLMQSQSEIERYYRELKEIYNGFGIGEYKGLAKGKKTNEIEAQLSSVKDIANTLDKLNNGAVLDDIELFEIKNLAFISNRVKSVIEEIGIGCIELGSVENIISILDPDNTSVATFYVYSSYSEELAILRRRVNELNLLRERGDISEELTAELLDATHRAMEIEGQVRERLSGELKGYCRELICSLSGLAKLDSLYAKARLIERLNLSVPKVSGCGITKYVGLFHPQVKCVLEAQNKLFSPVDIDFKSLPVTIIGANMGGKTVVLKSVALAQLMFQFGFGVAADSAEIDIKERILISIGDQQNETTGVSSFAAEVREIDSVIKCVNRGERVLAVIDEPARSTNPIEGKALVAALLDVLMNKSGAFVISTHYDVDNENCERLKVKGLIDGKMDYQLVKVTNGDVPHEALRVAETLGVDSEWIERAKMKLKTN